MPSPPAGPTVWVGPNRAGAPYERATVGCATPSGRHYEVTTAGDGRRTVECDAAVPVNTAAAASTSDHCALVHLHEATVLANTVERAAARHFCTWVGPAQLVSVNPCAPHPDIYGDARMAQFRGDLHRAASSAEAEPHAFAVGEAACARITRGARVAILATGESGAGKTEVNRLIVSYLVARWDVAARPGGAEGGAVREGMLRSSELLEALGNARMLEPLLDSLYFGRWAPGMSPRTSPTVDADDGVLGAALKRARARMATMSAPIGRDASPLLPRHVARSTDDPPRSRGFVHSRRRFSPLKAGADDGCARDEREVAVRRALGASIIGAGAASYALWWWLSAASSY